MHAGRHPADLGRVVNSQVVRASRVLCPDFGANERSRTSQLARCDMAGMAHRRRSR
ncbi:hypothetical protein MES5069_650055 [Mesorhizobium escarrei]|uniref:Uncharacterized protein n=1 Tax=Mesorhizobium escarrei TaxID=666018 RepID=A0ABN8KCY1_9HYPH|nr:hypothetical protein MES5069_650055 [Mesorhizobium escarrei]